MPPVPSLMTHWAVNRQRYGGALRQNPCCSRLQSREERPVNDLRRFGLLLSLTLAVLLVPADANTWPCFHGSLRDNKSNETGLLKTWPETGPQLVWQASGLGEGYSSVSVAGGKVFCAGKKDNAGFVVAFDMAGKQLWKADNGAAWETTRSWAKAYSGSRSTPTWDNGVVYHLGETGRLAAFDAATGKERWAVDIRKKYDADIPEYGYAESVLIEGDRLYCTPAGGKAFVICLNKDDGSVIWEASGVPGTAAFNSPVTADFAGYHMLLSMSASHLFALDTKSGKVLWTRPLANKRDNNICDPIFHDGHVFASSGYGRGSILLRLTAGSKAIEVSEAWDVPLMDNHHGGVVLHEGHLYGSGHESKGWFCLDFMTGKQQWNASGKGSLTYADGMLYCLEEKGTMKLVTATPEEYREVGSFDIPRGGKGMYWAHPVVCDGRLYVRHADKLYAYKVK